MLIIVQYNNNDKFIKIFSTSIIYNDLINYCCLYIIKNLYIYLFYILIMLLINLS